MIKMKEANMAEASQGDRRRFRTGVIMDPIEGIATYKDSTFAMLLDAQRREHEIWYMEPAGLTMRDGIAMGHMQPLEVRDNTDCKTNRWFSRYCE